MAPGLCELCGKFQRNVGNHRRFCKARQLTTKEVPKTTDIQNERGNVAIPVMVKERTLEEVIEQGILPGIKPDRSIKVADDLTLNVKTVTLPRESEQNLPSQDKPAIQSHVDPIPAPPSIEQSDIEKILDAICKLSGKTPMEVTELLNKITAQPPKEKFIESEILAKEKYPDYLSLDQYTDIDPIEDITYHTLPQPIQVVRAELTLSEMAEEAKKLPHPVVVESEIKSVPVSKEAVLLKQHRKMPRSVAYGILITVIILILYWAIRFKVI